MKKIVIVGAAMWVAVLANTAVARDAGKSSYYQDACLIEESEFVQSGGGFKIGQCYGFINGVVGALHTLPPTRACLPKNGAVERYKTLWMAYLNRHPDKSGTPAFITLRDSLAEAFPCEK
jgi:hypothetical protein